MSDEIAYLKEKLKNSSPFITDKVDHIEITKYPRGQDRKSTVLTNFNNEELAGAQTANQFKFPIQEQALQQFQMGQARNSNVGFDNQTTPIKERKSVIQIAQQIQIIKNMNNNQSSNQDSIIIFEPEFQPQNRVRASTYVNQNETKNIKNVRSSISQAYNMNVQQGPVFEQNQIQNNLNHQRVSFSPLNSQTIQQESNIKRPSIVQNFTKQVLVNKQFELLQKRLSKPIQEFLKTIPQFDYNQDVENDGKIMELDAHEMSSGCIYTGQWKNGQRHGKGVQIFKDGSYFEGYMKDDKINGKGRKIFSNLDMYEGQWLNDQFHGQGIFTQINGDKYRGEFKNSQYQGQGVYSFNDGKILKGRFENGNSAKDAEMIYKNGDRYSGEIQQGMRHGFGICHFTDKNVYEGQWLDDQQDGKGKLIMNDGRVYIGEFFRGARHGQGTLIWKNEDTYQGEFVNNMQHGKGVQKFKNGNQYEGDFVKDKREGYGIFDWPDGENYQGEWKNDLKHGQGTYIYDNGDEYNGNWKNGLYDGKGIMNWVDGSSYEGQFQEGMQHGQGYYQDNSTPRSLGIWQNGVNKQWL